MAVLRNWMAEARRLEASGDLHGAVSVYRKALARQQETAGFADLSVHNGLGDVYLRAGHTEEAIAAFEGAAQQCEDQQLYANGIALCKKILRNAPDHTPTYRRAARLSALSGLEAEARLNYAKYRELVGPAGREKEAREALRELVEITADEESTVELVETLVADGERAEALEILRTVKRRRDEENRGVVIILRAIQELQKELESMGDGFTRDEPESLLEPSRETAQDAEPLPEPKGAAPYEPVPALPDATPGASALEITGLLRDLEQRLSQIDGDEQARRAIVLIDQMLDLDPGRVDLLSRKLSYAFMLGSERVAVETYLELGQRLDRDLDGFSVRTLSSQTTSGNVTTAVQVEEVPSS